MADASILDPTVSPAPKQYTISGAQELFIKSISAQFDGSGAGGPWIPAVQLLNQVGEIIGTYPMDTSVAAGASADVSFFPGVKQAAASGGGVPTVSAEQLNQSTVPVGIANGFSTNLIPATNLSGPILFTGGGGGMICLTAGLYSVNANIQLRTTPWTAGGGFVTVLFHNSFNLVCNVWVTFPNNSGAPQFPQAINANVQLPPMTFTVGQKFTINVLNLDGALNLQYFIQTCSILQYT